MITPFILAGGLGALSLGLIRARSNLKRRTAFINSYNFPRGLRERVRKRYPHLRDDDLERVIGGLRQYFRISVGQRRTMVSMPSQVVDVAWHEFILFTRNYQDFCQRGLGRFLHHVPAEAMTSPTAAQRGIRRAWYSACSDEKIPPKGAPRLPLLFALDDELKIPDGFSYRLNCLNATAANAAGDSFCASHIGCGGGGCGGSDSGGNDGSGGDGGGSDSGCGGGCGGGGD